MREIEQRGLYYEDFELDTRYLHRPGRTVTEADNVLFTTLTMNTQALHLDAAWSARQPFGERLVNSMFTLATLVGACVLPQPAYGISCTQPQVDGGTNGCYGSCDTLLEDGGDPTNDPDNFCFVDSGTP